MLILKYIYYKFYKLAIKSEKQWGANIRMPQMVAFFSISLLQFFNLLTIFVFLSHGMNLFSIPRLEPMHAILSMSFIFIFNYYVYIKDRRYIKIEKRFDKLFKEKETKLSSIVFWTYVVLTFPLFILTLELFVSTS